MQESSTALARTNDSNPVLVIARPHPFSLDVVWVKIPAGLSLREIVGDDALNCQIEIGGTVIEEVWWPRVRPKAGMTVIITRFPQGGNGGTGKMIFRLIAFAALAALSYGIGHLGWLGSVGIHVSSAATAGIAAAVGIGGSLLLAALIPPAATGVGNQTSPTSLQGINGVQNAIDPYGAVTCVFGTMLLYPKLAARSYTLLAGDSQFVKCLFDLGYGQLAVANLQLGTDALTNYTGVDYQIGPSPTLFPRDVLEIAAGNELDNDGMSATHATGENADEGGVDLVFGGGLFGADTSGNNLTATCKIKIEFESDSVITIGAIAAIPVLNSGAYTGDNVTAEVIIGGDGTGAEAIATVGYVGSDFYEGGMRSLYGITQIVMLSNGHDYTHATASLSISYDTCVVVAEVADPQIATMTGGAWGNVLDLGGLEISHSSATSDGTYLVCASSERKTFRVGVSWKFPQRALYNIRITRHSTDWGAAPENNRSGNLTWTAIRTTRYALPSTTPTTKLAMQIKASDQLNGTVSNFNLLVSQQIPVWNGSTWTDGATSNPAWIYRWILRDSSANPRRIDASRIDDEGLKAWGAECDAKGFTFNYTNDRVTTVFELLKIVCAAGRASFTVVDGKYSVVRDVAQTVPIQIFTPRNTSGFQGNRAFVDVVHGLRVQFINPQAGYQQDELLVYDDGYDESNATKFEQLQIPGCADALMAWKLGRYHLAVARLRPNTYSWNTDVEHLVCNRGDLVYFASDVISVGIGWGRVKSITMDGVGNVTSLTVDEPQTVTEPSGTYAMRFRCQNGTVKTSVVTFEAGAAIANFALSVPTPGINPGDLFMFGIQDKDSIPMLINRIEPTTDLAAKITAVDAGPAVLTADEGYKDAANVYHAGHPPLVSSITGQPWVEPESGAGPTFTLAPRTSVGSSLPLIEVSIG